MQYSPKKAKPDDNEESLFDFLDETQALDLSELPGGSLVPDEPAEPIQPNKPARRSKRSANRDAEQQMPVIRKPVSIAKSGPLTPPRPGDPIEPPPPLTDAVISSSNAARNNAIARTNRAARQSLDNERPDLVPAVDANKADDDWPSSVNWVEESPPPAQSIGAESDTGKARVLGYAMGFLLIAGGASSALYSVSAVRERIDGLLAGALDNGTEMGSQAGLLSPTDTGPASKNPVDAQQAASGTLPAETASTPKSLNEQFRDTLNRLEELMQAGNVEEAKTVLDTMDRVVYGYGGPEFEQIEDQIASISAGASAPTAQSGIDQQAQADEQLAAQEAERLAAVEAERLAAEAAEQVERDAAIEAERVAFAEAERQRLAAEAERIAALEAEQAAAAEIERQAAQVAALEAERLAAAEIEQQAALEAERVATLEAERLAAAEIERQAALEAERIAALEAERLAAAEIERQAALEAERIAALEAERVAAAEIERQAALEAERVAALEAERLAAAEIERQVALEAERIAALEAERVAAAEIERQAALEAERVAAAEVQRLAALEAARVAALEAERQAAAEIERQSALETERVAALEAERQAVLEAERRASDEAKRVAALEAQRNAVIEAERQALEQARQAEAERQANLDIERQIAAVAQATNPTADVAAQELPDDSQNPVTESEQLRLDRMAQERARLEQLEIARLDRLRLEQSRINASRSESASNEPARESAEQVAARERAQARDQRILEARQREAQVAQSSGPVPAQPAEEVTLARVETPAAPVRRGISDGDLQQVYGQFSKLEKAVENRDINAVLALTEASGARIQQVMQMFENNVAISAQLRNVSTLDSTGEIQGTLQITRLERADGSVTGPPLNFGLVRLSSVREGGGWSRIRW